MLHIVVCLKQVPDPEAPKASFKVDSKNRSIIADGVPPVISPYDDNALEAALQIKESHPESRISALAFGPKLSRTVMMKALAVGADELFMIEDSSIKADGRITTAVLAHAVRKIGFDLVLTGRQAADTNGGWIGPALAAQLGVPCASWARSLKIENGEIKVERIVPGGREVLRGPLPALATVSHEADSLRIAKLADIRNAKKKPIHNWSLSDLEIDELPKAAVECTNLEAPSLDRRCRLIGGDTPAEAGGELARVLIEDGVLPV